MNLSRLPLARQLALATVITCLLAFSILIAILSAMSNRSALKQTEAQLTQQMTAIAAMLEDSFAGASDAAKLRMEVYKRVLGAVPELGTETQVAGGLSGVRVLKAGETVLNNNLDYLQRVRDVINADPAVMVLHDNKFIRVATLLRDNEGKSQIGVPLPENGPEATALREGKSYFGLVNRDGKFFMSNFEPVIDKSNKVIGAISVRVSIDSIINRISETTKQIKVGDTGYAFIFAPQSDFKESRMLVHPSLAGKTVGEINNERVSGVMKSMVDLKNGTFYYDWVDAKSGKTGSKVGAVATVKSTGWIIGSGSWVDEFTAEARALRNTLIIVAIACGVLIVLIVAWLARQRLQAVTAMVGVVRKMGDGDLTHTFAQSSADSRCETDLLNQSLGRMQKNMADIIGTIHQSTRQMTEAVGTLNASSDKVSTGSQSQSDSSSALAASVEELSVSISHVSENAEEAQKLVADTANAARRGHQQVEAVVGNMNQIETDIRETAGVVHELGERTTQITNVMQIIKDVADQTNLLALNAAIEAARAGEAGRGFAVVADEVRKLAERTTQSTREISSVVLAVQQETQQMVRRIEEVANRVTEGVASAQSAGQLLGEIEAQSQCAVSAVNGIANSTKEQRIASQEIAQGVEKISGLAESNTTAALESQSGAEGLHCMSEELEEMVRQFRT